MLKKASEYSASYINNNLELKNKIQYGIDNNLVFKFGDEEIEKLRSLSYVVIYDDVIKLFEEGYNLGNCSEFAKLLSYAYPNSKIGIGYFKPSYNGENGHAWMETDEYIYDTTLLLKIDKWNYQNHKYHLGKYICLDYAIYWGLLATFIIKYLHPFFNFL